MSQDEYTDILIQYKMLFPDSISFTFFEAFQGEEMQRVGKILKRAVLEEIELENSDLEKLPENVFI